MLTALDLAGIPLEAADRSDDDPIVLAGGHAAFNPEPIADFLDAAVLGDGEQIVLAITEVIREWKAEGSPGGRDELLMRLAESGGVYVPKFYDVDYLADGRIQRVAPNRSGVPWRVPSTPSWTWTSGPTRRSRWSRWPRPCTSGSAWRSSAAAPAAAGSARPA